MPVDWMVVCVYASDCFPIRQMCLCTVSTPLRPSVRLSSCWWPWCRCPAWWSSAGSRAGSSCRPAFPGCAPRPPACPPSGRAPTGRRAGGSGTPASRPPPAPAGPAASRTPLWKREKKTNAQLARYFRAFSCHQAPNSQSGIVWLLMGFRGKKKKRMRSRL